MNYEKIRESRNIANGFANLIGLTITNISLGTAECYMEITKDMLNPINSIHGGVLFTIADVTGGAAASSHGYNITTVDSSFHYLNAGIGTTHLTSSAREIKHGKRISVYDVSVFDEKNKLLAEGIFTYMSLGTKIEL